MKKIFIFLLLSSLLFGSYAVAQNFGDIRLTQTVKGTGLSGNLEGNVAVIISSILGLLGTIFLVLTIYAGILWMTASGEEAKIEKAQEIIKAAVIGLAIVMSAYTITYFIGNKLRDTPGDSNQNKIGCCTLTSPGNDNNRINMTKSACDKAGEDATKTSWVEGSCPK